MKYVAVHIITYVLAICGMVSAVAAESTLNEFCPVTIEENADPAIFVDYESHRVQFCCQRCKKKFLENPGEYVGSLPQFSVSDDAHGESTHDHVAVNPNDSAEIGHTDHGQGIELTHDHGTDHGEASGRGRAVRFAGKFHPLIVHFPIALILVAALCEVTFMVTGRAHFSIAAHLGIRAGALTALVAITLGWAAASFANYPGELAKALFFHRWLGVSTGVGTVLAGSASLIFRGTSGNPRTVWIYRALLFLSAALVGVTGHFGAVLIYGYEHFQW